MLNEVRERIEYFTNNEDRPQYRDEVIKQLGEMLLSDDRIKSDLIKLVAIDIVEGNMGPAAAIGLETLESVADSLAMAVGYAVRVEADKYDDDNFNTEEDDKDDREYFDDI